MTTVEIDKWKDMTPEEIDKAGGGKQNGNGKQPLIITSKCIYTPEQIIEQIKENIKLKLVEFRQAVVLNNGDFCMVGSGPSIGKAIVDAIKSYERTSGAVWQGA